MVSSGLIDEPQAIFAWALMRFQLVYSDAN